MSRQPIIETELGKEKQCSKCGDFWPLDPEFFYPKQTAKRKDGTRGLSFDAVCKACYEVVYRKRKTPATRTYMIRSKAEKMVSA